MFTVGNVKDLEHLRKVIYIKARTQSYVSCAFSVAVPTHPVSPDLRTRIYLRIVPILRRFQPSYMYVLIRPEQKQNNSRGQHSKRRNIGYDNNQHVSRDLYGIFWIQAMTSRRR